MSFNKNFNNKAHAPYNFIPLNEKVAKFSAPCILDDNKHNSFNTLKGISGEINLIITTKTPFFIGDSEKESNKDYKEFFSVDGKPQIPGSSLRGMIRNLVEIVSYGKFETYNNDKFYYRDVAGRSGNSLKTTYKAVMTNDEHLFEVSKMGGYLKQDDKNPLKFYITPANVEKRKQAKQKNMSINIIDKNKGVYDVFSGFMKDKKAYYHFNGKRNDKKVIELSYEDIKLYSKDNEKLKREKTKFGNFINVVYSAKYEKDKYPLGVPCFYVEYKGRVYFGHTPYFRIPYFKSVKEHVLEYEFGKNEFDLTECIFGKESAFATRVFFEDAKLGENKGDVFAKDVRSAVLMEPKPTSFNMYLENKVGAKLSQIKHYNDEVNIRGYKMYHHKTKISDNLGNGNDNVTSKIHEINSNVVFNGKIRFTNLKDYELGALMFVLNLPKNCFHKLGGAKPLGFGSVEIKASLSVYDITESYKNLFLKNDELKLSLSNEKKDFIKAFETEILRQIGSKNTSLWEEPRLKELEIILNYEKSKGINSEYMGFSKKETILPHPSELVKNK